MLIVPKNSFERFMAEMEIHLYETQKKRIIESQKNLRVTDIHGC